MKELAVSMHIGSEKYSIKNLDKIINIDMHNNRKYKNKNNLEIDQKLSKYNICLRGSNNISNDIKEFYKNEFGEAVYKYNLKQKDERRKIVDYLSKVESDKQTNIAVEILLQIGDKENWENKTFEEKKKTKEMFENSLKILEEKNIKVVSAIVHLDETSPHLHVVAVPVTENCKRGIEKQVSQNKVITREVMKELRENIEKSFIEDYNKIYGENIKKKVEKCEISKHLSVADYKNTKKMLDLAKEVGNVKYLSEELKGELERTKKEIVEIEVIKKEKTNDYNNLKSETNFITNQLTELKTTKNNILKEKQEKELELDLYNTKIKEYKEKILEDKKEAERLEEEEKKIAEELKENEKKVREVKEELERKEKDYNDSLTRTKEIENKKAKLEAEKQKIEEFYKTMEVTIKEEREKIVKDVEDARIELIEEKKKLENENSELVNNNNELLKSIEVEKEKKVNIVKEKEKIEKENKEIENTISTLKKEKTNLEANKLEISAGVKSLLENQKNYSDTLLLDYKKIENKEVIKEVVENKYDNIQFTMTGYFYEDSIYKEDYKSSLGYYKNGKLEKEFSETETENLTYTVANAVYSIYNNSFNKVELQHNSETGKTFMNISYYEEENKTSIDTIDFKPIKTDNFIRLIKTKLTDFKNYIVEALEEKFNCRSNNKNIFSKENNQKNIDKKKDEIEY